MRVSAADIKVAPTEGRVLSIFGRPVIDNVGINELLDLLDTWVVGRLSGVLHYWVDQFTPVQPLCVKHRRNDRLKHRWG